MKKIYLFLLVLSSLSTSYSQCTATSLWPANTMTPTAAWTSIANDNYAGDYANINVVSGNIYEFSTTAANGSDVTYDSQLTLRSNTGAFLSYNDDFSAIITQSYISWTATYTGVAQIHLHEYNCLSNQTNSSIRMKMTSSGPTSYNCVSGTCVSVPGTGGTYPTLIDCQTSCAPPIITYNCVSGTCVNVAGPGGTYPTLLACQTSCVDPCASSPEVYLTNVGFYSSGTNGITSGLPTVLNYNPSNPNNYLNPGKNVRFKVKCFNNLTSGANLVSAQCAIQSQSAGVTLTDASSGLNNVAYGTSVWSSDEFEIAIANTVQPGTILSFDFTVTNNIDNTQYTTKCIEFVVAPLWYNNAFIDDDSNPDSQGDDDEIVEPNEIIEFLPLLENVSPVAASEVYGRFFDPNYCSDIIIWNNITGISGNVVNASYWNYNQNIAQTINPGESNMVPQFDFVFNYNKPQVSAFELGLDMAGRFQIFSGQLSLVKWYIPYTFNPSQPAAEPCTGGLNDLTNSIKQLVKIVDILGRETEFKTNTPLIYVYSDGTTEKIFKFE